MRYLQIAILAVIGLLAVGFAVGATGQGTEPQATRVGYLAFWKGNTDQLWVCQLDGTEQRRLSTPCENVETPVGFSSRNGLLAWWSQIDDKPGYHLRVWPVTGGIPKTIFTDKLASYSDPDEPAFTPDGKFIIFGRSTQEYKDIDWGLWQIDVDGNNLRRLTKGFQPGGGGHMISVSSDGELIAFYLYRGGVYCELCIVKRSGGNVIRTGLMISNLVWSPQGRLVVSQFSGKETLGCRLVLYDPHTRRISKLTDYHSDPQNTSGLIADTGASFSPDGEKMAYIRSGLYSPGLMMLMEMATKRTSILLRNVTEPSPKHGELVVAHQPTAWATDGSRVFFGVDATSFEFAAEAGIWSVRPNGSNRRKVVQDATLAAVFER